MNYLKKETGEMARRNLERAFRRFGNPMNTDKPRSYAKHLPEVTNKYWVGQCPKCGLLMHAAYYTQVGIRYMCAGCGYLEGMY